VQTTILALAASVPETKLQHQLGGWGSVAQVSPVMTWLIIIGFVVIVLALLKKVFA
jgi:hypothetical protein